jgi:K+-transporting ATPase ATPase C chain
MKTQIMISLKYLLVMTILTGIVYPVFMTGVAQTVFRNKANGSLFTHNGKLLGSELIGQKFDSSVYFWSRPSAIDYNPVPSGASNFGPTFGKLLTQVNERKSAFISGNGVADTMSIPKEMIFASGSGLDPHTSPEAVRMQVNRVARARNFSNAQKQQLLKLIDRKTEGPQYGLFGEKRINVLLLNLELDQIKNSPI